ncbi:hypothetical protein CBER1_10213 [Cercospora berteroae]|uniref:Xylanolytic transcriptional activator regulatory domain-containing protein n=1 Tax=Cercospora berteroae TaxID=357750 RepID=A0A2S6CES3_9PEZI|nr:hypothetical protein CBER1_10213 [Cercospora berteroae]
MAEDVDVLGRYLGAASAAVGAFQPVRPYVRISNSSGQSIVYNTVPRQRRGLLGAHSAGVAQREIIEHVVAPHVDDVLRTFFDRVHPCFPVLDAAMFWDLWLADRKRLSSTLVCDMIAVALPSFARSDDAVPLRPCPDVPFVWNQAVLALRDDFLAPSVAAVHAATLDMLGRPIFQVTGNIINVGRTVSLAHSLGLHRDPSSWQAPDAEKSLRIRMWWGVLTHDYWSSLCHGTPPNICRANYDVPLFTERAMRGAATSESHIRSLTTFVHLCSLTQILGDVLPLVYALSRKPEHALRSIRRIESSMDDWEDSLPDYLRTPAYGSAALPAVNGASGLWFYFLSVKLIVHRLAYKITAEDADASPEEARKYRAVLLRNAALAIVEYTTSLRISQLREFWLPYTAHLLVSATTILLRCAIDLSSPAESVTIIGKLAKLLDFLRDASRDAQWDLAHFCLEQCAHPIETIAAALSASSASISVALSGPGSERRMTREMEPLGQEEQISQSEMLDPSKLLDDLFDPPWYNFDAASDLR